MLDRVFPLSDAVEAIAYVRRGDAPGKVVVTVYGERRRGPRPTSTSRPQPDSPRRQRDFLSRVVVRSRPFRARASLGDRRFGTWKAEDVTTRGNFKRRVRARAAKTGQSYTTALRHFRRTPGDDEMPKTKTLRLATARTTLRQDPRDADLLRDSGQEIRRLMRDAYAAGARLVVFPEGAICSPHKRVMSTDPNQVGPADWGLVDWAVLRDELGRIADLAGELGLWTVLGSVHRLTPPHRPHNSLYVLSDKGEVITRYDERMLSNTKVSFMYTPGAAPVTFEVDGVRIGLALGMEAHFPELFLEYERLDVDAVLYAAAAPSAVFATEAQAHAATNSYWVGYASDVCSGVISPDGEWVARTDDGPIAMAVLDGNAENLARPWRRTARGGIYEPHLIRDDPRSEARTGF